MDASNYATCLWPGLPELWYRGRWSSLPAAIVFAVAVNFLLVARFIYPEWLQPSLVKIACWVGVAVWIMLVVRGVQRLPGLLMPRVTAGKADTFADARGFYLQGQWSECEAILADCLEIDQRDSQALLMLASVYRQTGRLEAADQALTALARLETADGWWFEVQQERGRLQRARETSEDQAKASDADGDSQEGLGEPSVSEDDRVAVGE